MYIYWKIRISPQLRICTYTKRFVWLSRSLTPPRRRKDPALQLSINKWCVRQKVVLKIWIMQKTLKTLEEKNLRISFPLFPPRQDISDPKAIVLHKTAIASLRSRWSTWLLIGWTMITKLFWMKAWFPDFQCNRCTFHIYIYIYIYILYTYIEDACGVSSPPRQL